MFKIEQSNFEIGGDINMSDLVFSIIALVLSLIALGVNIAHIIWKKR